MIAIGELSRLTGLSISSIRFYESAGLIQASSRTPTNRRQYDALALQAFIFVRNARIVGMSVEDILDLCRAFDMAAPSDAERAIIFSRNLNDIRSRIRILGEIADGISRIQQLPETASASERMVHFTEANVQGASHAR